MITEQKTQSICPECFRPLPARRVYSSASQEVCLVRVCPEHGSFSSVIWRGAPDFLEWTRPKTPSPPPVSQTLVSKGCPFDCGLCPAHGQHTCTALLEITSRCDLGCPVCFADSTAHGLDPGFDRIKKYLEHIRKSAGACSLQISGGEPTMRRDLPDIISFASDLKFSLVQLNTNGLRLGEDPEYARTLKECGLESVFLQFDTLQDRASTLLRGRPLTRLKKQAVQNLARAGLGIVLVPTLVPGINCQELGDLLEFALSHHPAVRGIHFQPVSYFGRYPEAPDDRKRLTLPEIMQGLEKQTQGLVCAAHFKPPGCEHALCSFHAAYLVTSKDQITRTGSACCPAGPEDAASGAEKSIRFTSRHWRNPENTTPEYGDTPDDLDLFLARSREQTFTVSGMAFQDAWTLDLDRLQGCCIHVLAPDGRLIPFCAYNLTSARGGKLYRCN